ncbi:CotH kinase family protein [Gordonia sp. HY002]|uniref:CotH kinase family protein n=1 Tax=Gordonia zhenghanii TaxID=2911516 RepID=UPI001EF15B94|nr:CotH kinase family protein [Gordonia zhenghanii]MCF8571667.1 CotH kinase family protein [Gordonia zhenghanii]MCF8602690.1 CotH kinase family protein [Gordonia zhenghanii]
MASRDVSTPRRRLRHRIPTRIRRHWKWPAALVVFAVVVIVTMGTMTVRPLISGDERVTSSDVTDDIVGTVDLFDDSVDHEFSLKIADAEYADMMDEYAKNGEKKWVSADVTIDGTVVDDVGVRLKGNSTLMSLRSGGRKGPGGMGMPPGAEPPAGMGQNQAQLPGAPGQEQQAEGQQAEGQRGMQIPGGPGGFTTLSADDPASLPLLISFDKNAEGRAYQGMTQLSVRPGSPVLNEAMALSLTEETGQPTQRYAYTVYSVNDSQTTTRLLLEHPDAGYADSLFDSDGYLFKADASSRFEYVDDDQSSYSDQFKQINSDGNGNLEPIIKFLKWMKSADDAEFDEHLADWVDVDSFAEYLATQNLLSNMDDMSGPGQNYYLWYDLRSTKLSVISWDLNLAMQGDASAGPHDTISMGGGMGGPGGRNAGGDPADARAAAGAPGGDKPAGDRPGGDEKPGGMRGGNELKTRFLASKKFTSTYDDAYWRMYDKTYGDSTATDTLDHLASTVPVSEETTAAKLATEVNTLRSWITQRRDALAPIRSGADS